MKSKIKLTAKQKQAQKLAQSKATRVLFRGGSGSGKTFLILYLLLTRALSAPASRHAIFRHTAVACRTTLFDLTIKEVFEAAYPATKNSDSLYDQCDVNKTEMTITLPNKSVLMFGGLEDQSKIEKILGNSFATAYINEASEISEFKVVEYIVTRFRAQPVTLNGNIMVNKLFVDCNPPKSKRHWTYKAWIEGVNPESSVKHRRPEIWAELLINPHDNQDNLTAEYLEDLEDLSASQRKRFLEGDWQTENEHAMFKPIWIKDNRVDKIPDLERIVVAIDPAVSNNANSDETGIIVAGIDAGNHAYILDDVSGKYSPDEWAKKAIEAYEFWQADTIIAEKNQGGDMVLSTLRMVNPIIPAKMIHASRGKAVRAEPIAALYEKGLVHHTREFRELEDQLEDFTAGLNRSKGSPDRVDALVHCLSELVVTELQSIGGGSGKLLGLFR